MREYRLPGGQLIPPELQEQIADDVRAFDAAQTPDARSATALRKLANELPRIRAVLAGEDQTTAARQAVALEIVALGELGFTSDVIRETPLARSLMRRYGLLTNESDHRV